MISTVREVCKAIATYLPRYPVCVETGCVFQCPPGNEVHTTTNNIAEFICKPHDGYLYTYDIDKDHLDFAQRLLEPLGLTNQQVTFVWGDSVTELTSRWSPFSSVGPNSIDVLWLDAGESPDQMFNEYLATARSLSDNHFILIDDIHNPNSIKHEKLVLYLKGEGYKWEEIPTPTGLFVATKGYSLKGHILL